MKSLVLLLTTIIVNDASEHFSNERNKVYRFTLVNQYQLDLFNYFSNNSNYHILTKGGAVNVPIVLSPSENEEARFEDFCEENNIEYEVLEDNVEENFEKQEPYITSTIQEGEVSFKTWNRYSNIQSYLKRLQKKYPDIVTLFNAGKTYQKRDLTVIKISKGTSPNKPIIFIDGGIHANEWIAPATVLYIIKELVENDKNLYMLEGVDWHILPLLNPDGYEYSHTKYRNWRKNRGNNNSSRCIGTDLNRNFGYKWGVSGSSSDPCDVQYMGSGPFSEKESSALKQYILNIKSNTKLYLTFHSFGCYILHPWSYAPAVPDDVEDLRMLGKLLADSIRSVNNTKYQVGGSAELMYSSSGGSDDWAKAEAKIKYTYTIELPPCPYSMKQVLPKEKILDVVTETFEGIKTSHDFIVKQYS